MMEKLENKQVVDITLKKTFDMKMKQGHEMRKAFVDEVYKIYLSSLSFYVLFISLRG